MEKHHKYGTSFTTFNAAHNGDAPVKNWSGIGVIDFPDRAGLHPDVFAGMVERDTAAGTVRYAVKHC